MRSTEKQMFELAGLNENISSEIVNENLLFCISLKSMKMQKNRVSKPTECLSTHLFKSKLKAWTRLSIHHDVYVQ